MVAIKSCVVVSLLLLTLSQNVVCQSDVPVVCGGFVKSKFQADFTKIKVNLYSVDGTLKYSTDCAPNNGYFLLPIYDQGEYLVRSVPPDGWMITPNEVPLVVEGTKDPCSSEKDILFQLVGFRLEGKVTSSPDLPGPEGVEISFLPAGDGGTEKDSEIRHFYTVKDGRFMVEGVFPGTYVLTASHPVWKMSEVVVEVVVIDSSVQAPPGLSVLGYDVKGNVRSGGEPMEGVVLFLYAQAGSNIAEVNCLFNVPAPTNLKHKEIPLCTVLSDSSGHFMLYPLPAGSYFLVPIYQKEQLQFEIHPTQLNFTVSNDSIILSPSFEVQGYSVSGQVVLTVEGLPVSGAKVRLDNDHSAVTNEQGNYHLMNVTTGTYILKIEAPDMEFNSREVYISPSSPTLPPISPNRYLVCGDVVETIPTSPSGKMMTGRYIEVYSIGSKHVKVASTSTQERGGFCLFLPLGQYEIKVVIPHDEAKKGLLIIPEKQFIAMIDTPLTVRIIFTQFIATLSGSVACIEDCPENFNIKLSRSKHGQQQLNADVKSDGRMASFKFSNVLPGPIKVTLTHVDWCWESSQLTTIVIKGEQTPLEFNHTGYAMKYEVSHDTAVTYHLENDSSTTVFIGKGSICLSKPGVYHITPESCHQFEKDLYNFDTSSPHPVVLNSIGHSLRIPVHTRASDSSLKLMIRSGEVEIEVLPENVEKVSDEQVWIYSFLEVFRPSERLEIQPISSLLMFSPTSLSWTVGQDCPETILSVFQGSPGEIIEGKVEPDLLGVEVTLDLGGDGEITTHTDEFGYYRAGPVRGGDHIIISVALEGYIFEALDDHRSFKAIKLCHIAIQISSVYGGALAGVLVSASGADFRQNSFTDSNGVLTYTGLSPGQYFIKPFMREFDFAPSSSILNLNEGQTEEVIFTGQRVAFSCSGLVSTLNRHPLPSVNLQASGEGEAEECSSYSEITTTDSEGFYRLHGLMPGCQYNLSIKESDEFSHAVPMYRLLIVEEVDLDNTNFLLVSAVKSIYISGWVDTDPKYAGTLKAIIWTDAKREESPLHIVTVDSVGFFDFPSLPHLLESDYLITVESSLSTHSFKYNNVEQSVTGVQDSHIILQFIAQEVSIEKEAQSKGSVIALILVIAVAFALVNFEKVLSWVHNYSNSRHTEGFFRTRNKK